MTDKIWIDSHWYFDPSEDAWLLTGAGAHLIGEKSESILQVPSKYIAKLVQALDDEGWIKPRLDERLRSEDLKITHRLLDLLDKIASAHGKAST